MPHHWMVSVSKDDGMTYIRNNKLGRIHRYILDADSDMIDHINRNTLDNRKCNLRNANAQINATNISLQKNNKSGITGVSIKEEQNRVYAKITHNGKTESKAFAISKYGLEEATNLAIQWRITKEKEYGFTGDNEKLH